MNRFAAGDAFSSTFVASLVKTNGDVKKSLAYASVNAASVVEHFSAQGGFITFEEIEKRLNTALDEIRRADEFDYIVVNDEVNNAADRIMAIIRAEHAKTERSIHSYMELIDEN